MKLIDDLKRLGTGTKILSGDRPRRLIRPLLSRWLGRPAATQPIQHQAATRGEHGKEARNWQGACYSVPFSVMEAIETIVDYMWEVESPSYCTSVLERQRIDMFDELHFVRGWLRLVDVREPCYGCRKIRPRGTLHDGDHVGKRGNGRVNSPHMGY